MFGAAPPVVASLRRFVDEECNCSYPRPISLSSGCFLVKGHVLVRVDTKKAGASGTHFEERALEERAYPKSGASESANIGGMRPT